MNERREQSSPASANGDREATRQLLEEMKAEKNKSPMLQCMIRAVEKMVNNDEVWTEGETPK